MRKHLTIKFVKDAFKQDGNGQNAQDKTAYFSKQVHLLLRDGEISYKQSESLLNWIITRYGW